MTKMMNGINATRLLRRLEDLSQRNEILEHRDEVCNAIDCLFTRLSLPIFHHRAPFLINGGIRILLLVLSSCNGERQVSESIFNILVLLLNFDKNKRKNGGGTEDGQKTAMAIHSSGMTEIIKEVFELHHKDEDLRTLGKVIVKDLIRAGAKNAALVIDQVGRAFDLGISLSVYRKAQLSTTTNDQTEGSIIYTHEDDAAESTRQMDVALVLAEMEKYLEHEGVQKRGLKVIATYVAQEPIGGHLEPLVNESFVSMIIAAISSTQFYLQQLALSILMKLTCESSPLSIVFADQGGCNKLLRILDSGGDGLPYDLHQLALWTLANLCSEGKERQRRRRRDVIM